MSTDLCVDFSFRQSCFMFVSTFGFYLKHEKLLKQSGELNCWQYNLLACLLIHFKNSFPVHYYSSPATLFHCQEKDTWQRVWDKVIYLGLGDETIAVQKMLILCTEFSFNFACFVIFYFCSTGYWIQHLVLSKASTLSLSYTLSFLLSLFYSLASNFKISSFAFILVTFVYKWYI